MPDVRDMTQGSLRNTGPADRLDLGARTADRLDLGQLTSVMMRRRRSWLAIRLTLTVSLFAVGAGAGLACGSRSGSNDATNRLTTTVTTNGQVTTMVTGP